MHDRPATLSALFRIENQSIEQSRALLNVAIAIPVAEEGA
jgi:hypothetical protein